MAETLLELFRENARTRADRPAFVFLGDGESVAHTVTFGALAERAERSARRLLTHASPGDRALLLLEPGPDYVESFLGCLWAGIVAVPAYPARRNSRTARIDLIVANARPRLALTDDPATAARFESKLPVLLAGAGTDVNSPAAALPPHPSRREDVAFLQYTSGSTGDPRGVMVTHGNLLHNERTIRDAFRPDPDEVSVTWLPPYHDMGLIGTMLQPLAVGMTTIVLTPTAFLQRPLRWLSAISRYRATYSGGPDFAYALCARSALSDEPSDLDLSSWEVAYQGAERVRPQTLAAFTRAFAPFGFRREAFAPCFGLAEATLMVTAVGRGEKARELRFSSEDLERGELVPAEPDASAARGFMACGRPRGGEVRIVDPVTLAPCVPNRIGEVWVAGPSVAPGYYSCEPDAESVFGAKLQGSEARWLRTGDLGCFVDGELVVTGRLKDLIIIDGKNHAPEDLEATAAESHPAFAPHGTAAISFEDESEERLVILQEIRRTALRTFDPSTALRAVRQAVSEGHGVRVFDVAFVRPSTLPRTSSGKLRRHACADGYRKGELLRVEGAKSAAENGASARSELEALIRRLVSEELKLPLEAIDPTAPLSTLGLDSLSAEVLTGRLSRELGREIAPTLAYDYPTIERIVAHLLDPKGSETVARLPAAAKDGAKDGASAIATREPDPLGLDSLAAITFPTDWDAFVPPEAATLPARWLLFGDGTEFSSAFEQRLRAHGTRSKVSSPGQQDLDAAALRAGAGDGSAWDVLLRELIPQGKRFGVVHTGPYLDSLFELLRAVIRIGRANDLVLRVVATGAIPEAPGGAPQTPAADLTLRRVLKSIPAAHAGADVRLIDADTSADPEAIVTAVLAGGTEGEVAVRSPGYFAPRAAKR